MSKGPPKVNWKSLTLKQAAALIANWLKENDLGVVLVGSACVAVYLDKRKGIDRLDFMMKSYPIEKVGTVMEKIKFKPVDLRTFKRRDCPYMINFPAPPITVGDELITKFTRKRFKQGVLEILTPTDSVRCRLTTFYRWGDEDALNDAVDLAAKEQIDMKLIERWSAREWATGRFQVFLKELAKRLLKINSGAKG